MMELSHPKCNRMGDEFYISCDDELCENVTFLSDDFPAVLFTQSYCDAARDETPLHWHHELQLVWASSGDLEYSINGEKITLTQDRIVLINAGCLHSARTLGKDVKTICILFKPELFPGSIADPYLNPLFQNPAFTYTVLQLTSDQITRLGMLMSEEEAALVSFAMIGFIAQIFEQILRRREMQTSPVEYTDLKLFQTALNYVHSHYAEPITVEQLTEITLVNKNRLTGLFHKYTGMSPIRYLNEHRLFQAKELLLKTDRPVTDISIDVGYNQVSYFIDQFKRRYHLSPLQFRKQYAAGER